MVDFSAVAAVGCGFSAVSASIAIYWWNKLRKTNAQLSDSILSLEGRIAAYKMKIGYLRGKLKNTEAELSARLVEEQRVNIVLRDELGKSRKQLNEKPQPATVKCDGVSIRLDSKTSMNFSVGKVIKELSLSVLGNTVTVTVVKHNGIVKSHTFQNVNYSYRQAQQ